MKVLLLRVGALTTLVVLGWITIANAQRGGASSPDEGNSLSISTDTSQNANPLRPSQANRADAPSTAKSSVPPANRPSSDPFGLQTTTRREQSPLRTDNTTPTISRPANSLPQADSIPDADALGLSSPRNVEPRARYGQGAVPVSAEQPVSGPALVAVDNSRSSSERYASQPPPTADRSAGRYAPPQTSDSQPPAPFKPDPFAVPTNPVGAVRSDQLAMNTPAAVHQTSSIGADVDGVGQPGAQQLEGAQSPQLTIQKTAPKEIQIGKAASFCVTVRNTGQIPASDVEVRDLVPKGTKLLGTTPQAAHGGQGEVIWKLGTIRPGEEATAKMELMPTAEGEIGSVATVHFGADASARCIATRPQLVVETVGPAKVLIGEKAVLTITVSNPGTGVASGVVLDDHIPPGLQHPAGAELEYEVGDLKPGESKKLELPLVAKQPGPTTNLLTARAEGNLRAQKSMNLEVLAPQLDVAMEGPKRRYLERQATYQVWVENPGTAPAKQVELIASLPPGLKFVSANNAGYYEESSRTVRWRLEELPANERGSVELVTMPVEAGQQAIKLRGVAQKGLEVEKEQPVLIQGLAAILFQVADTVDPIGIGGETNYEVHVVNQGTKASSNVRLTVLLPPEVTPVSAEGPTGYAAGTDRVQFNPLAQLAPKADTTYRIRVKALKPGDLRTRFELMADDMRSPVVKEESTRVFADE